MNAPEPAPPPPNAPTTTSSAPASSRRELAAIALWWLAIVNGWLGFALWFRPGKLEPEPAAPDAIAGAGGVNAGTNTPGGAASTGIDMKAFVAAPPVPGRPSADALDAAIRRGTEAYLHLYVEPSLAHCEGGGFLDYVDADGKTTRLGPNVYVQCYLYLIVHLLMYQDELGIPRDDPLVQRALKFLTSTFDDARGRWIWSEEGCLHAKGLIALARFGEKERFEKGWQWARASALRCPNDDLFTMMQSGSIVQTLGSAVRSLTGQHAFEHDAPVPDEENCGKFLFALLASGRTPDDPEVSALARRLSVFLASNPIAIGAMNTRHVVGRAWFVEEYARWRFPPDDGYRLALAQMRAAGRGEWRINFMMRIVPSIRAEMVRALLEAGERGDELDAIVNGFVAAQEPDGAWRVSHMASLWGFDRPPAKGYKYGNMDGANTYLVTLGLISWRDLVLRAAMHEGR